MCSVQFHPVQFNEKNCTRQVPFVRIYDDLKNLLVITQAKLI